MAATKLKNGVWVVIADSEKALFLANRGNVRSPALIVVSELSRENPPTHKQGSDRPGRFHDGPSPHRSAVADTDWHRIAKERFADEIARNLGKAAQRGDFDEIILVAPPVVLGEIRKKLHKDVGDLVVAEVAKTLTNHPLPDIEKILMAAA